MEQQSDSLTEVMEYCIKKPCKNPKISVIVPAYNTEKYISRCLSSLIRQTLKEIEIILIDDGSTDRTAEIISGFADMDSRIKIISQSNQKQGAARNRGIEAASGEYLGFVDSDDWVSDDYFEKLYLAASKYDSDLALATNVRIGNGKTKKRLEIKEELFVKSFRDKVDVARQAKNPCPTNKIYRRELLIGNNIFFPEGVYCEDKLFTIRALYYSNGLVTVPGVYYYYFRNPSSTVYGRSRGLIEDKNAANVAVLEFLRKHGVVSCDREFWAVKKELRILGTAICRYEESLQSRRIALFGLRLLIWCGGKVRADG